MSSNYGEPVYVSMVHEIEDAPPKEKRCNRCRGTGTVILHHQETDCLDCEGYGSVLI